MPKITRQDWEDLRQKKAAFYYLKQSLFDLLMNKMYGPAASGSAQTGSAQQVDETDELMVRLARGEPPIQP